MLKSNRVVTVALIVYFIFLHLACAVFFVRSPYYRNFKMVLMPGKEELSYHYKNMLTLHLRGDPLVPKGSIFLIGDSITQGLCSTCIAPDVANYGIGTDTTYGMLSRLPQYESLKYAKAVMLAVGVNDIPIREDKEIISNLSDIILSLKHTEVLVSAILPVDENFCSKSLNNSRIQRINGGIKKVCEVYAHCTFFDSSSRLYGEAGGLKNTYHDGDGLHLNSNGYQVWIDDIQGVLLKRSLL